jgi:predicted phosphodiesterase
MERIKPNKTVTAILTSDWHLREDTPTCFIGNFQKEQWDAVDFISELQKRHNCPVVHAGDLFHTWKSSPWLLRETMKHLPKMFGTIYGQHDLPSHNLQLADKCGINVLEEAGKLTVLEGCHWGQTPETYESTDFIKNRHTLIWHHLTYLTKPFPGADGGMAEGILRKYPMYDMICTGDCHQSFTVEYQGRRLVNPGNLTRQTADQADFQPRVALWFASDNSIEWVNLPIQKDAISREHLEVKEQRDARIDAFVSSLNGDYKTEMSFEQNLESFFQVNPVRESVKNIIYKSLE